MLKLRLFYHRSLYRWHMWRAHRAMERTVGVPGFTREVLRANKHKEFTR